MQFHFWKTKECLILVLFLFCCAVQYNILLRSLIATTVHVYYERPRKEGKCESRFFSSAFLQDFAEKLTGP